ncbi:MAG: toprim domain-containing protein, partial [Saprospiraceae bacterium]
IADVLAHYGLKPDRNKRVHCPWHNDKTPSLQIYPKTNTWCCFSTNCKSGTGDALQMVENMEKGGKHKAIMKAKELLGVGAETLNEVFGKLKTNLKRSEKARQYFAGRGLKTTEVGYNAGGYPQLKSCLIFPLKSENGNIISLYGRSIYDRKDQRHFYLKNRSGLYPHYPNPETKRLILTESIIDAATLLEEKEIRQNYSVLALYGTNGLTEEHKTAIGKLAFLEEIILFFDGDEAGIKANEKHHGELKNVCEISKVNTPDGEDVNSLVQGHERGILSHLLEERKPFLFSIEIKKPKLNARNEEYLMYENKELKIVLLGGINIKQIDRLRVTMLMERKPKLSPLHTIRQSGMDLYNDGFVEKFVRRASEKLETRTQKVRLMIAELIEELEQYRMDKTEGIRNRKPKKRELTEARKRVAINYLKSSDLLRRTNADIGRTGVIGEDKNRLLMFLIFCTRKRKKPLHVISLGASGTGKTYLQERISALIPDEDKIEITALSDNAFYYFDKDELRNKLIIIEDMDGAENVLYQLRELMSKKRITKTVTTKDNNGKMRTVTLEVNGPICVAGTTTKENIYEDNANRSLLIYRDESRKQKERIMDYQRSLSAGKINETEEGNTIELFKDLQLLLQDIRIINPFAEELKIPNEVFKPLRTNDHYLQFIEAVTFYHQHQRKIKKDGEGNKYIEVTLEDIKAANYLLKDILLSKSDELSGACRKFFERLKNHLKKEKNTVFYASEIRRELRLSPQSLRRYLTHLSSYGLLKITGGNRYRKGYEYEICNMEEYAQLKDNIKTALDIALEKISVSEPVNHQ